MGDSGSAGLTDAANRLRWLEKKKEGGKLAEKNAEAPAWTTATENMLAVLAGMAEPVPAVDDRAAWLRRLARDRQATPEVRELARRRLREMGETVPHHRGGLGTNPLHSGALLALHRRWRVLLVWLRRKTAEHAKARASFERMSGNAQEKGAARAKSKARAAEVTVARLIEKARSVLGPWFALYDAGYFESPPHGSPIKVMVDGRRKLVACYSVETARVLGHLAGNGDRKGWARDQITAARNVLKGSPVIATRLTPRNDPDRFISRVHLFLHDPGRGCAAVAMLDRAR